MSGVSGTETFVTGVVSMNGISFVFPCLNEAETVKQCIDELKTTLSSRPDISYEIIVADNGSTDETAAIASAAGARVVPVEEKGYGAALKGGFAAATRALDFLRNTCSLAHSCVRHGI